MCARVVVVVLAAAGLAVAAPGPKDKAALYQKKADEAAWDWADERATFDYSAKRCKFPVKADINDRRDATITILPGGDQAVTFEGHTGTPFVVQGLTVYYADYHQLSTGCAVVAMDLKTGKQVWRKALKGLGPITHRKYFNAVAMDLDDGALRVVGKESQGRYIEFVDRETGQTLGHKVFPKD
jgi:hypothetical protein